MLKCKQRQAFNTRQLNYICKYDLVFWLRGRTKFLILYFLLIFLRMCSLSTEKNEKLHKIVSTL